MDTTDEKFATRALAMTPRGSHTLSKRPAAIPFVGSHYVISGDGATITTADGSTYIDWIGGLGATPLGHNHPIIMAAVRLQLTRGVSFSLPSVQEVITAEALVPNIPCAEQVRFLKTGSEACSAAISIARAFTGREMILSDDIGYHGWHDQFRVLAPTHPGVPDGLRKNIQIFKYGDLDQLEQQLDEFRPAAVIMEPARLKTPPSSDYLPAIKRLATKYGALLIFDEMILGGRHALAGGQEFFGVTPDLATFGKAFGAGFPLAFVAGRAEIMAHAWPISGTFSGEAVSLAACHAMLEIYASEDIIGQLRDNGSRLQQAALAAGGVTVNGYPAHFSFTFTHHDQRTAASVLVQECAEQGVLFHPAVINSCAVMSVDQVTDSCDVLYEVLTKIDEMDPEQLVAALRVAPYEDSVRR